jgi:translation initiation factor 5B
MTAAIIGFNIKSNIQMPPNVSLITSDVIYHLLDSYDKWKDEQKRRIEEKQLEGITRPAKIELMRGYVFRQNNPAVVGVVVLGGILKPNTDLMTMQGKEITTVLSIQKENETITEAKKNEQVAASLDRVTVGRQIKEGDVLISAIKEHEFRKLKEFKHLVTKEEIELLKEIAEIMRKENPVWGI